MDALVIVLIAVCLGCIPGAIAQRKGHEFVPWWLFGALLFVVALPLSLAVKPKQPGATDDWVPHGSEPPVTPPSDR